MKVFLIALALMVSALASAEPEKIFEMQNTWDEEFYRLQFRVNKPLNRAWVEVTTAEYNGDSTDYSDYNVKVEGLAYDPEINGVVIERNGERVVCGTFYNHRWTIDFGMSFRDTGRCKFTHKATKIEVDDGFYIRKVPVLQVFLEVI